MHLKKLVPVIDQAVMMYLAVFTISFLSFYANVFLVVDPQWSGYILRDSDQLVLEGILSDTNRLGRYWRPEIGDSPVFLYDFFNANDNGGEFRPYTSSYGLQVPFFGIFFKLGFGDYRFYYGLTALLSSCLVVFLMRFLAGQVSYVAALAGSLTLVVSPWFVTFADSPFWLPILWFAPLFAVFKYVEGGVSDKYFFAILYICFLVKFLSGYEFITTIGLMSLVPFFLRYDVFGEGRMHIIRGVALVSFSFLIAFFSSVIIHSNSLSEGRGLALREILDVAGKRTSFSESDTVLERLCGDNCDERIVASFETPPHRVLATYMIVPQFFPWAPTTHPSVLPCSPDPGCAQGFRDALDDGFLAGALFLLGLAISVEGISWILSRVIFVLYTCLVGFIVFRFGGTRRSIALSVSFLAPISWHLLAAPHSYIHTHMNYILWYLPFVPLSLALAMDALLCRKK